LFFLFKGTLNLWVAYTFPTDVWVNFKLFGGMGLMLVFVIGQAIYMSRFMQEDKGEAAATPDALPPPGVQQDKQP
jgi:intracellular septation protein